MFSVVASYKGDTADCNRGRQSQSKKGKDDKGHVDLDKCLVDIKKKLIGIYGKFVTSGKDLTTTDDTSILEEIERETFKNIEHINSLWKVDTNVEMRRIENGLYTDFKKVEKEKEQVADISKREEKKAEMDLKRKKERNVGGRRITTRS